jgi:hypothetical protein
MSAKASRAGQENFMTIKEDQELCGVRNREGQQTTGSNMKKFIVDMSIIATSVIEIEAESEEEAKDKAESMDDEEILQILGDCMYFDVEVALVTKRED